jgi:hypothetical protein
MMKQTIHLHDFREAFRQIRPDNFSYEGLEMLFGYLESCEDDGCGEFELDVIAFCCDFSESDALTIANDYSIDTQGMDGDEITEAAREHLEDEGALVGEPFEGSFVYRNF